MMSKPDVSPELFFETANAYQKSAALKAAVDLEIFTLAGDGSTADAIASKAGASERGIRILCDFLVINGFLQKEGNVYRCTPDSAVFLNKKSPAYLGSAINFLLSKDLMSSFDDLTEIVRRGRTLKPGEGTVSHENPIWVTFAEAMAPLAAMPAEQIAKIAGLPQDKPFRVLDIAAGHGMFGIAFARQYPLAQIYAVDWAPVLRMAKSHAERAGVANRYHLIPGSAFEVEFGMDYDIAMITNFLHHFDPPTNVQFMRKVFGALKPEGKAITLEFVPNEDRVTPKLAGAFAMVMLGTTASGDAYTYKELEEMMLDAGFTRNQIQALPPSIQSIIISEK